jgi:hypothetical protein
MFSGRYAPSHVLRSVRAKSEEVILGYVKEGKPLNVTTKSVFPFRPSVTYHHDQILSRFNRFITEHIYTKI